MIQEDDHQLKVALLNNLALIHYQKNKRLSEKYNSQVLKIDPDNIKANNRAINLLLDYGKLSQAESLINECIAKFPETKYFTEILQKHFPP